MEVNRQVAGIKANDEKVLRYVYASNFSKVEDFVLQNSGSSEDAKDIYQEAFIAVWRNINRGQFEPQNETALSGYLFQIARNKWLDHLRAAKNRKVVMLQVSDGGELPEETAGEETMEYLKAVEYHYRNLGEQCREVLRRFYFKKESLRDIAAFFSWTEASARNNKYRCLQKLRAMVTQIKHDTF